MTKLRALKDKGLLQVSNSQDCNFSKVKKSSNHNLYYKKYLTEK